MFTKFNNKNSIAWIVHRKESSNLGDRLLGKGFEQALKSHGLFVYRYELTFPESTIRKLFGKLRLAGLLSFLRVLTYAFTSSRYRPKIIFIGGGQLLLPHTAFLFSITAWAVIAKLFKAKLILFSVGCEQKGQPYKAWQLSLVKFVTSSASYMCVRDTHSQNLICQMLNISPPDLVPDTAYGLKISNNKFNRVGVNVCPASFESIVRYGKFKQLDQYLLTFLNLIKTYAYKEENIYIFSTDPVADNQILVQLAKYLQKNLPDHSAKILNIRTELELLDQLSHTRVTISSRLHALILTHIHGGAAIPVNANEKIKVASKLFLSRNPYDLRDELCSAIKKSITH